MRYGACSAVGQVAGYRVHSIRGSRFGLSARANPAFHVSGVCELLLNVSGKDKMLTCSGYRKSLYAKYAFKCPPQHPVEVWRILKGMSNAALYPFYSLFTCTVSVVELTAIAMAILC